MFIQNLFENPRFFFAVLIVVVVSICLHELAHGLAAVRLGDRTPIQQGRITLNPLVHMGPMSIVFLLLAGIAWGAMPIDRSRLRGRYAESLVAAAGPLTNIALAIACAVALGLWQRASGGGEPEGPAGNAKYLLMIGAYCNFFLAMFNLIPWPPLDGAHILGNLNPSYGRFLDSAAASGAAIMGFFVLFLVAGRFLAPAAMNATTRLLELVRGW